MDPIALASASGFVETHALGSSVHTPTARRPPRSSWNPLPALPRLDDEVDADKIVLAASFHSLWLPRLLAQVRRSRHHYMTICCPTFPSPGQETLKSPQQSNDAFLFTVRSMTSLPHSLRQSTSSALHGASASPPHAGLPAIPAAFSPSQLCLFAIDTG
uniref:Uncharacterized protein n=1 Tax=Oryza rufipogon TaxID=4529 RepID=A0A0E0RIJ1_ORYRU